MRLAVKLCLGLGALLAGTMSFFVWAGNRSLLVDAARRQDEGLWAAWERVAQVCAVEGPRSRDCWSVLRGGAALAEPSALAEALILDPRGEFILHTDFYKGRMELRGRIADRDPLRRALEGASPNRQDGIGPDRQRVYSIPLLQKGSRVGTLVAGYREAELERSLTWVIEWARRRQGLAVLLGLGAAVLAALALAQSLLRPLAALVEGARRVAAGDFNGKVPETSADELGFLSREFNRMTDKLGELDRLKDQFVAQVTHDLRAPLSGMLGQADLLLGGYKGKLSETQEASLKTLESSGRELAELIDNILDVTRLEAGALNLEPLPIDVADAVESVLEAQRARAQQLGVALASHLQPELEPVSADAQAFRRVLNNLVSNALKFTPAGGEVSVSARRESQREAVFAVSDTGPGIPPHRLDGLFKKFSQVPENQGRSRGHPGTGLGLAICRELVEAHGGRIWAESPPGEGARFKFTLPLAGAVKPAGSA